MFPDRVVKTTPPEPARLAAGAGTLSDQTVNTLRWILAQSIRQALADELEAVAQARSPLFYVNARRSCEQAMQELKAAYGPAFARLDRERQS